MRIINYRKAINEALSQMMEKDERIFLMGLGVDDPKGIFGSTLGLCERFGSGRVFDIPIAENSMTGIAVGAAIAGKRPILTHQRMDFLFVSMDQIANHAAKCCFMSGGKTNVPLVIRAVIGRGWGQGAQHSQATHANFMHIPGLKVVMPSTPYDVKGLLVSSILDENPVVFLEHRWLYDHEGEVPEELYSIPLSSGDIKKKGKDLTCVATSLMVIEALKAGETLEKEGIDIEIIDPRTVKPLDEDIILESVKKTGRLVIADIGWKTCGFVSEIAALVSEKAFSYLRAPIVGISLPDLPTPTSCALEKIYYPGANEIVKSAMKLFFGSEKAVEKSFELNYSKKEFTGPF